MSTATSDLGAKSLIAAAAEGNAAQIQYWNDRAGIIWTEFQERLDAQFAPLTAIALNAAAPSAGENVLDIGSGCGETVLELATPREAERSSDRDRRI